MYELINSLIGSGNSDIVAAVAGSLTIIFSVTFIDMIYRLIRAICKKGEF